MIILPTEVKRWISQAVHKWFGNIIAGFGILLALSSLFYKSPPIVDGEATMIYRFISFSTVVSTALVAVSIIFPHTPNRARSHSKFNATVAVIICLPVAFLAILGSGLGWIKDLPNFINGISLCGLAGGIFRAFPKPEEIRDSVTLKKYAAEIKPCKSISGFQSELSYDGQLIAIIEITDANEARITQIGRRSAMLNPYELSSAIGKAIEQLERQVFNKP